MLVNVARMPFPLGTSCGLDVVGSRTFHRKTDVSTLEIVGLPQVRHVLKDAFIYNHFLLRNLR